MSRLPPRPDLDWKEDGTPVARAFDDVYFSLSDGLEETRNVFLKACGLPERWQNTHCFTIAELGFGSGLNFLGTLDAWVKAEKPEHAWLHFTSVEKFLMSAEDAARILGKWPDLSTLTAQIIENWPVRTAGLQRIAFPELRATLTLFIGDVQDWLTSCHFRADAWFLDGFAPAKNDSMWGEGIFRHMAEHSAKGCLVGTYTVAGAVRRGLSEAGFEVSKLPGFGRKRERLEAVWTRDPQAPERPDLYLSNPDMPPFREVVIVGAGIAGACTAAAFASRGFPVTVLERQPGAGQEASGNRHGLVMPRLDAGDTPQARLLIQAYLRAIRFYTSLESAHVSRVDVEHLPGNENERRRFGKLIEDPPLDESWLSGMGDKLIHKGAAIVCPEALVPEILARSDVTLETGVSITGMGELRARFGEDALIILAAGWTLPDLYPEAGLPVIGKMGQVDWAAVSQEERADCAARASGTYAIAHKSEILFGATFEKIETGETPAISDAARAENMAAFEALCPDWKDRVDPEALTSRASVRATTPDRMPLAGFGFQDEIVRQSLAPLSKGAPVTEAIPFDGRVMVLSGLGARGFTFAPLLADLLVSQALGEPLPLGESELEQVSPIRFAVRAVRRGQ